MTTLYDVHVNGLVYKRGLSRHGADRYALFMMTLPHVRWCLVTPREAR